MTSLRSYDGVIIIIIPDKGSYDENKHALRGVAGQS